MRQLLHILTMAWAMSLVLVTVTIAQNAPSFDWLVGTWKLTSARGEIVESWRKVNDSTFTGRSVFVRQKGDTALQETLKMEKQKGAWVYVSTVINQNNAQPVTFAVIFTRGTEFICENPSHDFPQRISYRLFQQYLFASIEGKTGNRFSKRNFDYSRVD